MYSTLKIRGTKKVFRLAGKPLKTDSEIKDLGIIVSKKRFLNSPHKQQTEKKLIEWSIASGEM